ncbi:hypothetical protein [Acerihabitans arboris]|uniref:DUF4148 domain-containing protein n=1 Tax=Acerihabitans arboris TaxID=2691583 RepID=A0A845SCA5_9GAMM|nr:hypothetical protein [Acerihabitans arboris]NDL61539.1 hypothetical protein [Acerihabitans arboris]
MMKRANLVIGALALSAISFGSVAADAIDTAQYDSHQAVLTTISARTGMPPLPGHHSERAVRDDNRAYPMTSVSGQNNMHNTSVVYE